MLGKSKNHLPPAPLTYGATREKLRANGFLAVPAAHAYIDLQAAPYWMRQPPQHFLSELPVAVACAGLQVKGQYRSNQLHYLLVTEPDPKWRDEIDGALESYKLARGPVRIGSDESSLRPFRIDDPEGELTDLRKVPFARSALDGAVQVAGVQGGGVQGGGVQYAFIPLDAHWPGATLLDTKFTDLPSVSVADLKALMRELAQLKDLPPAPTLPTRGGWLGLRS